MFEPRCLATTLGSLPHTDVERGTRLMFAHTPAMPAWVQFPKRAWRETMMVQFTGGMAGLLEEEDARVFFNSAAPGFVDALTDFYTRYLAATEAGDAEAWASFGLSPAYAAGWGEFLAQLPEHVRQGQVPRALKGQVTGPVTLGLNLLDETRRSAYYDEQLHDVVVKAVTLNAVWQVRRLQQAAREVLPEAGVPVFLFMDEPSLAGFGSQTLITVSRADVIRDINAVAEAMHAEGGLVGVHCEENTDWSLLMESDVDVLSFDAYAPEGQLAYFIQLYQEELRGYLNRGGRLAWGIVPTLDREAAATETLPSLRALFERNITYLTARGFDREALLQQSFITPSCGAGGVLTPPLAERVLGLLQQLSAEVRGEDDRETR